MRGDWFERGGRSDRGGLTAWLSCNEGGFRGIVLGG